MTSAIWNIYGFYIMSSGNFPWKICNKTVVLSESSDGKNKLVAT